MTPSGKDMESTGWGVDFTAPGPGQLLNVLGTREVGLEMAFRDGLWGPVTGRPFGRLAVIPWVWRDEALS